MRLGSIRFLALRCTIWLALGTAPTFAQGADDCASATPISGTGLFLTGTGATTSPQQPSSCGIANHDVWYLWTPIVSSQYEVSTCGNTNGADTVLAVYPGPNCPTSGSQIACSDDDCGGAPWNIEAWVSINVVAGSNYLIQIGSQTSGGTFGGYFHIIDTAPAPCGPNTGPDVIVGDLHLIANYASQVVGGVGYDALSLGTYACNIGTDGLDWMGWNNHHPLVDNNLYKYSTVAGATRIEQLGMSWLRHTGTPVSDSVCCGACQALDTSHLGEHCADPETAAETGFQSYLGPRWQVNAAWGTFPFPPANPPYSGSVARRCQVKVSDLEPSSGSVHYFGEAQYVAQDDATAGNAYNNA